LDAKSPVKDNEVPTTIGAFDELVDDDEALAELPQAASAKLAATSVKPPRSSRLRDRLP
jgi:hypothetical protein